MRIRTSEEKKTLKMWGLIWRHCKDLSTTTVKTLYCSLVRPRLEYCSAVWSPIYIVDLELMERAQKKFLRTLEFKLGRTHVNSDCRWIIIISIFKL